MSDPVESNGVIIRLAGVHKIYRTVKWKCRQCAGLPRDSARRFVALMGASGSGSHAHEYSWLPDRPTRGHYFLDGADVSQSTRSARRLRNVSSVSSFKISISCRELPRVKNVECPTLSGRTA